jgi:hypothetical protein
MLDILRLCSEFKAVQTNGEAARPRGGTALAAGLPSGSPSASPTHTQRGRGDSSVHGGGGAAAAPGAPYTTAVSCLSSNAFFAGHSDGVVRSYAISTGELQVRPHPAL